MGEARQKEFFVEEKETPPPKKERKKGGVIPDIPAGVVIGGEPAFNSSSFIRYTEEGESFPWRRVIPNDGALWYERASGGVEYMPTGLGRRKGEPMVFLGALRQEIQRKPKKAKLQYELPLPEKEK